MKGPHFSPIQLSVLLIYYIWLFLSLFLTYVFSSIIGSYQSFIEQFRAFNLRLLLHKRSSFITVALPNIDTVIIINILF